MDRLLTQALTVYEQDLHSCGHPLSKSTNPAMADGYEADAEVVCHACAAAAKFRAENKHLEDGAIVRVTDIWPLDEALPEWEPPKPDTA